MSPRGGKCARVSTKVAAAKGRQVRQVQHSRGSPSPAAAGATNAATTTTVAAATATTTTTTAVTSNGTAVATTKMDRPAATTACNDEGRLQTTGRMRESLESSSEPARENGAPVHRYPERQRRRERHAAGRKHRPPTRKADENATAVLAAAASSCSTSSSTSCLSSPSSSCASSRRSTSPPSYYYASSPTRSSTASSVTSDPLAIKVTAGDGRGNEDHRGDEGGLVPKRNAAEARRDDDGTVHGSAETTTTSVSTASSSTAVSSPSPFSSPVSASSASCRTTAATTASTTVPSTSAVERLRSALESYDRSRIYLAHVCYLDWRDLPGKRRGGGGGGDHDATRRCERVWVVGAADHEGHHRTRLLVAGRHWRPRCLRRVNMLNQPVVYAGGGRGSLTADLFLWWFHREFAVTAMAMHPDGAVLVAESADYLPPESDCVAADGLVRLFVVPKDCMETRLVVRELRVRLASGVLSRARCGVFCDSGKFSTSCSPAEGSGDCRLDAYLKRFTLKEAFADLHRAWLSVRSETFARSWTLPRADREDHPGLTGTCNGAILPHRIHTVDQEEDRMLLVELQTLAREVGLEINDDELGSWIVDEESALARLVKKREPAECEEQQQQQHGCRVKVEAEDRWSDRNGEEDEDGHDNTEEDDGEDEPTAEEAVGLLSRVLTWMEREPLDPGLLLAVRSMRDTAALMVSMPLLMRDSHSRKCGRDREEASISIAREPRRSTRWRTKRERDTREKEESCELARTD